MDNTTYSNEDYLEAILLNEKNGETKSIDVAHSLCVSKPAVALATKELIHKGLINKESYGNIILTSEGRRIAKQILHKHHVIQQFLLGIGVEDSTAQIECCKIEHIISDDTLLCLTRHCKKNGIKV